MARSPNIGGRYRSRGGAQELELRVDVGRGAPFDPVSGTRLACLSGDLFDPPTGKCVGSFIAKQVVRKSPTVVEATGTDGTGAFESLAAGPTVRVTVRLGSTRPGRPTSARVEFLDSRGEEVIPARVCAYVDRNFREVSWQLVVLGEAYPFESLEAKVRHGKMTVAKAFERAGFKLTGGSILRAARTEVTVGARWNDAELHAAMQECCRSWRDQPQWNLCVLAAPEHELGAAIRGIMFDQGDDYPRQGCCVFSVGTDWSDSVHRRDQLFTYAHEIGHVFNVPHSWDREYGGLLLPQGPNQGLADLSWMNNPEEYIPVGRSESNERAYWRDFKFRFAPAEVNYLRHSLCNDIIPGGKKFIGTGAVAPALVREQAFDRRATDARDLKLQLRSGRKFVPGEPVIVEVKLATKAPARPIHANLHPHFGNVQIGIRHAGRLRRYRPPIVHCAGKTRRKTLSADEPPVYKSAYVGYGSEGLYFKEPGRYELVACYVAPDGSRVVTDPGRPLVLDIDWHHHDSPLDAEVSKLLLGEQQGMLFLLNGSDKLEEIAAGRDAFAKVLKQFGGHPLARYVKFVQGINSGRPFKRLTVERGRPTIKVRPAIPAVSVPALSEFLRLFRDDLTFDNLTLNFGMRRLARSLRLAGKRKEANEMLTSILPTFVDRVASAKGKKKKEVEKKIGEGIKAQVKKERALWNQLDPKKDNGRA